MVNGQSCFHNDNKDLVVSRVNGRKSSILSSASNVVPVQILTGNTLRAPLTLGFASGF
jgi:hypothetical protein